MLPAPLDELAPRDRSRVLFAGRRPRPVLRLRELSALFGHLIP
jgi:hypothetical protein